MNKEQELQEALQAAQDALYSTVQGIKNQVCLNVESDFVPDWNVHSYKYIVIYRKGEWVPDSIDYPEGLSYLSTKAKAQQVCDILNGINLKPVGVK